METRSQSAYKVTGILILCVFLLFSFFVEMTVSTSETTHTTSISAQTGDDIEAEQNGICSSVRVFKPLRLITLISFLISLFLMRAVFFLSERGRFFAHYQIHTAYLTQFFSSLSTRHKKDGKKKYLCLLA